MTIPTLSVAMTSYNQRDFLERKFRDVFSQSVIPSEFVVVDDASTDGSQVDLQRLSEQYPNVKLYINQKNMGVAYAVDVLVANCTKDYLVLTTPDDQLLQGFFERSLSLFQRYPQAALCSSPSYTISESGEPLGRFPTPIISGSERYFTPRECLALLNRYESWMIGSSVVYNRGVFIKLFNLLKKLGCSSCDDLMLRVIALKHGACFIPEPLGVWRLTTTGHSVVATNNVESALHVLAKTCDVMKTEFSALFPAKSVVQFRSFVLYDILSTKWLTSVRAQQDDFTHNTLSKVVPHKTILTRILSSLTLVQYLTIRIVLAFSLGLFLLAVRRELLNLFYGKGPRLHKARSTLC